MDSRLPSLLLCALLCSTAAPGASDRTSIRATATIEPRTSVVVSTDVLEFVVEDGSSEPTARVEFTVGVRAMPGTDVRLLADAALPSSAGPDAAAVSLAYEGRGTGAATGVVADGAPVVIARWLGGGQRRGHVVFVLRGASPGVHTVPVRFRVSVP